MTRYASKHYFIRSGISVWLCMVLAFSAFLGAVPQQTRAAPEAGAESGGAGPAPVTVAVYASEDTYVRGGSYANTNYKASSPNDLQIKNHTDSSTIREAYLKFDLSQIPGIVTRAELHLYAAARDANVAPEGNPVTLAAYRVADDTWSEDTLTYNNRPAKGSEQASFQTLLNRRGTAVYEWISADLTSYIAGQHLEDQLASVAIADRDNALNLVLVDTGSRSNKPYLSVAYIPGDPEDAEPPVWPEGASLSYALTGHDAVLLSWPAAQDQSGLSGYRIYANGVLLATVPGEVTSYEAGSLVAGETYQFRVEAGDGNQLWTTNGPRSEVNMPLIQQKLLPAGDTYVQSGSNADNNYGASDVIQIKRTSDVNFGREALLKFDLSQVKLSDIGTALLYVYGSMKESAGTAIENQLYSTAAGWSELEATWNTRPAAGDYLASFTTDKTAQWHTLDVTQYVRRMWQSEESSHAGFLISQASAGGLLVALNSRENTANQPYLQLRQERANPDAPAWGRDSAVTVTHSGEDELSIAWTPAEGAEQYRIYLNGVLHGHADANALQYTAAGLEMGRSYTVKVEAGTAAGAWSTDGPLVTAATRVTKLVQTKLGNIFYSNEPLVVKVETGRPAVNWRLLDVWGAEAAAGTVSVQNGEGLIQLPSTLLGYFMLEASAVQEGRTPVPLQTTLTVLSPFHSGMVAASPFGINTHGWSTELPELASRAGIKDVRGNYEWGSVEKQKGIYSIPISDEHEAHMNAVRTLSLEQIWLFAYTNPFYDNNSTPYTDEGREGFANYSKAVLDGYNGSDSAAPDYELFLKNVEVYNEFNIAFGDRGTGPADSRPEYYYPLLKKTYETVKAAHPDVRVAGMATAGAPLSWLESVMRLGGLDYLDVISIHPYVYPKAPEQLISTLRGVNQLVSRYNNGQTMPLWLSELGWPTHLTATGVSEKISADYLVRSMVISLANGAEKIYWYDLMDDGTDKSYNEHNFGLVHNKADLLGAYTPKPSYTAYAVLTRQLADAVYDADLSQENAFYQYRFIRGAEDIRVAWAVNPTTVAVSTQGPVAVVDFMGNEKVYTPVQGKIYLTLSGEPVYIHGDIDGMEEDATFVLTGEPSIIREQGQVVLGVTNPGPLPLYGRIQVDGLSYPFGAPAGGEDQISISIAGRDDEGTVQVQAELYSDSDEPLGRLYTEVAFNTPYAVEVKPYLPPAPGADPQLQLMIHNHASTAPLVLNGAEWALGDRSGTVAQETIPPSGTLVKSIPLPGLAEAHTYAMEVHIDLEGFDRVNIKGDIQFNRVAYYGGEAAPTVIDFYETGSNKLKADQYTGPEDLSGTFSVSWDEDNFYLEADVTDDIFLTPFPSQEMFKNDSIQFAMTEGIPGMGEFYYEYGLSMTADGPQIYCYSAPSGIPLGIHDNGDMELTVARDEENKLTRYRLKMPWRELEPILPVADSVISFSFLVNENDTGQRDGFVEWGSGIGGTKDPGLYRSMQLMPAGEAAQTDKTALAEALAAAAGLSEADYTVESWQLLAAAKLAAQSGYDSASSTQQQADAAAVGLQAAIAALMGGGVSLTGPDRVGPGEDFALTYGLRGLSFAVYAKSLTVQYDPELMEYTGAEPLAEGFAVVGESAEPGRIRLLAASTGADYPAAVDAPLLKLLFRARETAQASDASIVLSGIVVADENGEEYGLHGGPAKVIRIEGAATDKSALLAVIALAQAELGKARILDPAHPRFGYYPEAAVTALRSALEAAEAASGLPDAGQEQVDTAANGLEEAMTGFAAAANVSAASIGDLAPIAVHYDLTGESPLWSVYRIYDLNGDGVLNIADLSAMALKILP
ncbi:DNRLRE domain-containing protein [Paenibacillus sp. YN15]|uniref:CBM96 family carbohydrate-binding protein n=1 Tax=Paenibacillus sp. YN15 TaxID=1742774 RepID=UPI000DCBD438|nr:DNRLRE domain-containing protein [Paenibacillus sp. YN15]RAV05007.1 hypothetical protein DQG13_03765 [Paenibacillus sp. YN15]